VSTHKKPSKWDKSFDTSFDHSTKPNADGDLKLVQGSSTIFVVEDELPPPACTRNIVAKFRELEASSGDKAVPLPGKATATTTPSRFTPKHLNCSDNGNVESLARQGSEGHAGDQDSADESAVPAGRQNGEERGRSAERSEVYLSIYLFYKYVWVYSSKGLKARKTEP